MIRRLIILLLIVGCEETGLTTNSLTSGTTVTDTLYISHDTTIYVYDTLIVNFDTTITIYDTVIVLDTLIINNKDCAGVEGGTAQYDNCGVCDTDLTNDCVPDCAGVWGGTSTKDCNGVCNGDAVLDNCGICDYELSNDCLLDCSGTWGGDMVDANNDGLCDEWVNLIVSDIDGNTYETIQIGTQLWMKENLKTTQYQNGEVILSELNDEDWVNLEFGAFAIYPADSSTTCEGNCAEVYGNLYNSYAINDERSICPEGWHVPTSNDITILTNYLGGLSSAGDKMKSTGTIEGDDGLWQAYNINDTNESGFTALPSGFRNSNGKYTKMGMTASFAKSSLFSSFSLNFEILGTSSVVFLTTVSNNKGCSVRCLRD